MATKTHSSTSDAPQTVPGLETEVGQEIARVLQARLHELNDLHLTLKHAHWNVVGPRFIGVHEMLDPQVDAVRLMVDDIAERMATLGAVPIGTPGALVAARDWEDYPVLRAETQFHLAALNTVYDRVITDHRAGIEAVHEDPITEDMLITQTAALEKFQWFIRAHMETSTGKFETR